MSLTLAPKPKQLLLRSDLDSVIFALHIGFSDPIPAHACVAPGVRVCAGVAVVDQDATNRDPVIQATRPVHGSLPA